MKKPYGAPVHLRGNKGIVAVYVALGLVVFIGFTALAVDVGYLMVGKNELQNAADAAALAAARQLGVIYEGTPLNQHLTYECAGDCQALIAAAATDTAASNKAAGLAVAVQSADIEIGRWDKNNDPPFQASSSQPDAVRVKTRRDATSGTGGPIATFFARVFGKNEVSITTTATAALTSQSTASYGELELPIGISSAWGYECGEDIHFYPTRDSCAGWTDFFTKKGSGYDTDNENVSDVDIRTLVGDIESGAFPYDGMPSNVTEGDTLPFTGGTLSQPTFLALEELFFSKCEPQPPGADCKWETTVVVYERPGDIPGDPPVCGNPVSTYKIVGFANLIITEVIDANGKYLKAELQCVKESGRGGGGSAKFGTAGTIPGLVQ